MDDLNDINNTEFHLYTLKYSDNVEQGFIMLVKRDGYNNVTLTDILMINKIEDHELKTRFDIIGAVNNIRNKPGGNIPNENKQFIMDLFNAALNEDNETNNILKVDEFLENTDLGKYSTPDQHTINEIVKNMLKK